MSDTTATQLITAEEYARLPDRGVPTELVRGEVIELTNPGSKHGSVCNLVGTILSNYVIANRLGWVFNNDSGVVTERDPDTVRGPDVWFVSADKLPIDADPPVGLLDEVPDIVFEVLSPSNRPGDLHIKIGEYLNRGIPVVCVLDPFNETARLYHPDGSERVLGPDEELEFPDQLPGFRARVGDLFHPYRRRQP